MCKIIKKTNNISMQRFRAATAKQPIENKEQVRDIILMRLQTENIVLKLLLQLTPESTIETDNSMILSAIHNILTDLYSCQEEFENTKGVSIIRKSKKDRHHNVQKKKDKRTDNDL